MKDYVLGFIINEETKDHVVLVRKLRPEWQAGYWNGIGGKVQPHEARHDAMARECKEETGLEIPASDWVWFARIYDGDALVHCFYVMKPATFCASAKTTTDEEVLYVQIPQNVNVFVFGTRWLLEMAIDLCKRRMLMVLDVIYTPPLREVKPQP